MSTRFRHMDRSTSFNSQRVRSPEPLYPRQRSRDTIVGPVSFMSENNISEARGRWPPRATENLPPQSQRPASPVASCAVGQDFESMVLKTGSERFRRKVVRIRAADHLNQFRCESEPGRAGRVQMIYRCSFHRGATLECKLLRAGRSGKGCQQGQER